MSKTIQSIADKVSCGGAVKANTGKLGCLSLFGTPEHIILLTKGHNILPTDNVDIAYLKPLVQKGTAIPLIGASSFEDVSGDDQYSENASGEKRLNLKGLPEYKLMFEEGHEFYREMAKLESYKAFDAIIIDEEGNWLLSTSGDKFAGMSAGHVTPELTQRKVAGGDAESKSILIQFLDRLQWDRNYAILHADQLDFTPSEIPAVNGVDLEWDTVPADTDTDLVVSANLSGDRSSKVEGLQSANFIVKVNGSGVAISGVVESSEGGVYTITIPALASTDVVEVDLWDNSLNVDVTDLSGILYRSEELTTTIA